jgi:acetyl esterase/lipase
MSISSMEIFPRKGRLFVKRLIGSTLAVSLVFIATQDLQVFPGAIDGFLREKITVPNDAIEFKLTTSDNKKILAWRVNSIESPRRKVVLLFHGNADSLTSTIGIQRWLAAHRFTNYALEYRGYPGCSGFPSEKGLYLDGEAAMDLVLRNERVTPQDVVIFGFSIGTGPASFIAQKYQVHTLILLAPYVDLKRVASDIPLFGFLSPFFWYNFPNYAHIQQLRDTCVIDAHGKLDSVIPYYHSEELRQAYRGSSTYTLITSETGGHNDLLASVQSELLAALDKCIGTAS